jgi:hypothetical protein
MTTITWKWSRLQAVLFSVSHLTSSKNLPERKITKSERHPFMNQLSIRNHSRTSPLLSLAGRKRNTVIAIYRKRKISPRKHVRKVRPKVKAKRVSSASWR